MDSFGAPNKWYLSGLLALLIALTAVHTLHSFMISMGFNGLYWNGASAEFTFVYEGP